MRDVIDGSGVPLRASDRFIAANANDRNAPFWIIGGRKWRADGRDTLNYADGARSRRRRSSGGDGRCKKKRCSANVRGRRECGLIAHAGRRAAHR